MHVVLSSAWPEHHVERHRRHRDQSDSFQDERAVHARSTGREVGRSYAGGEPGSFSMLTVLN